MNPSDNDIMGTNFYTVHKDNEVYLGVLIPGLGVLAELFEESDWIDWLREELSRSHLTEIPRVFNESRMLE